MVVFDEPLERREELKTEPFGRLAAIAIRPAPPHAAGGGRRSGKPSLLQSWAQRVQKSKRGAPSRKFGARSGIIPRRSLALLIRSKVCLIKASGRPVARLRRAHAPDADSSLFGSLPRGRPTVDPGDAKAAEFAPETEHNLFMNDWFFAAPSATADTFGRISSQYASYRAAKREAGLGSAPSGIPEWFHFYLALHVHYGLDATEGLQGTPEHQAGTDFTLVRLADVRYCHTNSSVAHLLPPPPGTPPPGRALVPAAGASGQGQPAAAPAAAAARAGVAWASMQRLCPTLGRVQCNWASLRCHVGEDVPA